MFGDKFCFSVKTNAVFSANQVILEKTLSLNFSYLLLQVSGKGLQKKPFP